MKFSWWDVQRLKEQPIRRVALLALVICLIVHPATVVAGVRRVVVLYPVSDAMPGNALFDQGLRHTFETSLVDRVEIYNEYLDLARFPDERYQSQLAELLRQKYATHKIDVIIAAMAPSLDFALKYRAGLLSGVPIVFAVIDERELKTRSFGAGVVGEPMRFDLVPTLDLALRIHADARRVVVIAGASKTDSDWEAQARKAFRDYEDKREFIYLAGLPMDDLMKRVATIPSDSFIYYLHVQLDGSGHTYVPAEVAERIAATANVPVYGHIDSYLGRGIVGGRLMSFEAEGKKAALSALRTMAGKETGTSTPEDNSYMFDWRQLQRWGITEEQLPPGSIVRYRQATFWEAYRWHIFGVSALCLVEAVLICFLLLQMARRRRAEQHSRQAVEGLRDTQRELRALAGRLLQVQETERRRIARELHDGLSQSLALLAVELELVGHAPPKTATQLDGRMKELSARVKQLSSSVHGLSHNLHPSKLEQLGFVAGVRGLCKETMQAHGLAVEFTHQQMPPSISDDTVLCLYRIAQEALSNVIKHSGARHARVDLSASDNKVCMQISDDGKGFDLGVRDGKEGLGLVSMRERLYLLGGTIVIESRISAGTRIEVQAPLSEPSRELNARPEKAVPPAFRAI